MKAGFRNFSQLLKLSDGTINRLLASADGVAFALKFFAVILLIAGLGVLFGIPTALRQLTLAEQIDQAVSIARSTSAAIVAQVTPIIAEAESATEAAVAIVEQQLAGATAQINGLVAGFMALAATTPNQAEQLLQQGSVTVDEVEQLVARGAEVAPEQLNQLLSKANATPEQAARILASAGISSLQLELVRAQALAAGGAAMAQMQPLLDRLGFTEAQLEGILAQLATTPEQFNQILQRLAVAPDQVGQLLEQVKATPAQLEKLAADVRAEAVKAEPPLGTRPSRVVRLFGEWLSVPFRVASDWLLFALVLLVVSKLLGGRATLPQHIAAVALASAPLVLLFGNYIPDLGMTTTVAMGVAIHYFGRMLALIGLAWAALLLLKTLSTAHRFNPWMTAGAIVLTWVTLFMLIPEAGFFVASYLFD